MIWQDMRQKGRRPIFPGYVKEKLFPKGTGEVLKTFSQKEQHRRVH